MQRHYLFLLALVMIVCSIRCTNSPQSQTPQEIQTASSNDSISIEPGFYSSSPEYERVSKFLDTANASIGLDYHQGIQWYDRDSKSWSKINTIEKLKPLLDSVGEKNLLRISTGKAMWEKYAVYIDSIINYANTAGYRITVVTGAHSSGTIVSKVVHHNKLRID